MSEPSSPRGVGTQSQVSPAGSVAGSPVGTPGSSPLSSPRNLGGHGVTLTSPGSPVPAGMVANSAGYSFSASSLGDHAYQPMGNLYIPDGLGMSVDTRSEAGMPDGVQGSDVGSSDTTTGTGRGHKRKASEKTGPLHSRVKLEVANPNVRLLQLAGNSAHERINMKDENRTKMVDSFMDLKSLAFEVYEDLDTMLCDFMNHKFTLNFTDGSQKIIYLGDSVDENGKTQKGLRSLVIERRQLDNCPQEEIDNVGAEFEQHIRALQTVYASETGYNTWPNPINGPVLRSNDLSGKAMQSEDPLVKGAQVSDLRHEMDENTSVEHQDRWWITRKYRELVHGDKGKAGARSLIRKVPGKTDVEIANNQRKAGKKTLEAEAFYIQVRNNLEAQTAALEKLEKGYSDLIAIKGQIAALDAQIDKVDDKLAKTTSKAREDKLNVQRANLVAAKTDLETQRDKIKADIEALAQTEGIKLKDFKSRGKNSLDKTAAKIHATRETFGKLLAEVSGDGDRYGYYAAVLFPDPEQCYLIVCKDLYEARFGEPADNNPQQFKAFMDSTESRPIRDHAAEIAGTLISNPLKYQQFCQDKLHAGMRDHINMLLLQAFNKQRIQFDGSKDGLISLQRLFKKTHADLLDSGQSIIEKGFDAAERALKGGDPNKKPPLDAIMKKMMEQSIINNPDASPNFMRKSWLGRKLLGKPVSSNPDLVKAQTLLNDPNVDHGLKLGLKRTAKKVAQFSTTCFTWPLMLAGFNTTSWTDRTALLNPKEKIARLKV